MAFLSHEKQSKQRKAFFVMMSRSSSIPQACPKHFLETYSLISTTWRACGLRTMWETTEVVHEPPCQSHPQHCSIHLCDNASNKSHISSLTQHSNSPQVQFFDLIAMNSMPKELLRHLQTPNGALWHKIWVKPYIYCWFSIQWLELYIL